MSSNGEKRWVLHFWVRVCLLFLLLLIDMFFQVEEEATDKDNKNCSKDGMCGKVRLCLPPSCTVDINVCALKPVSLWQNIFQLLRHRRDGGTWTKRSSPLEFSNARTHTLKAAYRDSENISDQSHMLIHYWYTLTEIRRYEAGNDTTTIQRSKYGTTGDFLETYTIISLDWTDLCWTYWPPAWDGRDDTERL